MSVKKFTEEEQQILAQNPYTISVTATNLYTSKEFKEEFLKRYLIGDKSPRQIVSDFTLTILAQKVTVKCSGV